MTIGRGHEVRRLSIRVALGAAALVGLVYLLIAAGVVAFVTGDLTAQIDRNLARALSRPVPPSGGNPFEPAPPDRPFGPQILVWTVTSDGTVIAGADTPGLPAAYRHVTTPQTVTLDATEIRIRGAEVGDSYVVVGQTMDQVAQARSTVLFAEALIAPILLTVVFLGAVAIGGRVAMPIERARRRQLEFTADASHELRTPLSVIEANASLALTQPRDEGWYRDAFGRVDREARRMRRLIDDLLWLARFDASQAPVNAEPVDLGVLAAQTVDRFAAVAETRGVRLDLHAPSWSAIVAAPPELLDRLLGVLLDNACKYSPEGGGVDVTVANDNGRVGLTVDDAGPGIPEGERPLVFDRFHRAAGGPSGAGLGLAIGDAIVRATAGRWQVGTSPAGGARMSVSWPRALAAEHGETQSEATARKAADPR